jgi:hypothetical protein
VTKGKYQGLEKVSFSHGNSDRTCMLSLTNYNLRESGTGKNDRNIVSDPNNHLCTVKFTKVPHSVQPFTKLERFSVSL